jgi:hypothetical protein
MTNIITESHDSPPYFQHLLVPTSYPICKTMLINQVLVDSVLRTNYLTLLLTLSHQKECLKVRDIVASGDSEAVLRANLTALLP